MASPASETWWSVFLDTHGRDSEEESAFVGYLSTHEIAAGSDPGVLDAAYAEFVAFIETSAEREADPGPTRAELAAQQAVAEVEKQFVAKSRGSAPGVEKPQTAATRPAALRDKPAEASSGSSGANPATSAGASPETSASTAGASSEPEHAAGRSRRSGGSD